MGGSWQDLRLAGLEHHRELLADAAQRRRVGQLRRGRPVAEQTDPTVIRPRPIMDSPTAEATFTAQELRRLTFLRWRYWQGQLTD
jgi:hypothetical protein